MFAAYTNFIAILLRRQNPSTHHRFSPRTFSTNNTQLISSDNSVEEESKSNPNPIRKKTPLDIAFEKAIRNLRQLLILKNKKSILVSECDVIDYNQDERPRCLDFKQMLEISPELVMFIRGLEYKGYLNAVNLSPLDLSCFASVNPSSRWSLRVAAWRFGTEHQQIAKYLSKKDVKNLVLFGCPTTSCKSVQPAKRLRSYFGIQEDTVCNSCKLNTTCRYNSQSWRRQVYRLELPDVLTITVSYALELVAPELTLPNSVKYSTNKLLMQVAECM
ncbi:hypothetical protein ACHQM5_018290 [Ranunculus cassubicifolius]